MGRMKDAAMMYDGHLLPPGLRPHPAAARRDDPATSKEAARAVSGATTAIQAEVLAYAKNQGRAGFTDRELGEHFGVTGATYRTRRSELTDAGMIVDSGLTKQHLPSPRRHSIWLHKDYAP